MENGTGVEVTIADSSCPLRNLRILDAVLGEITLPQVAYILTTAAPPASPPFFSCCCCCCCCCWLLGWRWCGAVVRELCVVRVRASSSLEADAARLPAGHLAVVTSVGLHVLLDRYELGPRGQEHVGFGQR